MKQQPDAVKLVIADMAGTVIDHGSCAPAGVFVSLFARHGIQITFEQARGPMGLHKRDHIAALFDLPNVRELWKNEHGKKPAEKDIDAFYEEFIPLQIQSLPDYGDLIPGVVETVNALRKDGVKVATTTGYDREMLKIVLASAKAGGFKPDAAYCAADVPFGRPAPWMIHRCMEAVGTYPPKCVVKVGDTVPDIDAGHSAGCWTVGVTRTGNALGLRLPEVERMDADELTGRLDDAAKTFHVANAHYVIESFADIGPVIKAVGKRIAGGERP